MADDEIIIVRSLTESDLGIFDAHRALATSKQRAINMNANIVRQMLTPELFAAEQVDLPCITVFQDSVVRQERRLSKPQKNWRLGGPKLNGDIYSQIDCMDFVLIRTRVPNDGTQPLTLTFVSKKANRLLHAGLVAMLERHLKASMASFESGTPEFDAIAGYCSNQPWNKGADETSSGGVANNDNADEQPDHKADHNADGRGRAQPHGAKKSDTPTTPDIPPMPDDDASRRRRGPRKIAEKIQSPHILERMLKASSDLSAPAQLQFIKTVEQLALQLRHVLTSLDRIVIVPQDHKTHWASVAGQPIGFVDGGLANLSMLGSAPIAARVGGYVVRPGVTGEGREDFVQLKLLIDELYAHGRGGVYADTFPDVSALRDAARISIESAGAVRLVADHPDLSAVLVHGALVNPVSRYTDIMQDGQVRHPFPHFSETALRGLLPSDEPPRQGRDRNFISVHLRQLQLLEAAQTTVCGVIEREATTTSVIRAVLDSLDDDDIRDLLPRPSQEWKQWFRNAVDPSGSEEFDGQRITDSLLFMLTLQPGEALRPVSIDRNEMRRAPQAWQDVIQHYPQPQVSYLQVSEWSSPIRIEMFAKDLPRFTETASLILHSALLLPRYAFPVGLDIVDKFARIPNWMSRPVNTNTAVTAMKRALDTGDTALFDALRRMLCGSSREFLLRPGMMK